MTDKTFLSFKRENTDGKTLIEWWHWLQEHRGDRAELRRCRSPVDVCFLPSFSRLLWSLEKEHKVNTDALALIAGLMAQIKVDTPAKNLGSQLVASKKGNDNSQVSELRFRRLLKINDRNELYTDMVRIIKLVDGAVDLCHLAKSVYWWSDKDRKKLALDYYGGTFTETKQIEKEEK